MVYSRDRGAFDHRSHAREMTGLGLAHLPRLLKVPITELIQLNLRCREYTARSPFFMNASSIYSEDRSVFKPQLDPYRTRIPPHQAPFLIEHTVPCATRQCYEQRPLVPLHSCDSSLHLRATIADETCAILDVREISNRLACVSSHLSFSTGANPFLLRSVPVILVSPPKSTALNRRCTTC